jgi:uncharacterized protein (DUF2267 family)
MPGSRRSWRRLGWIAEGPIARSLLCCTPCGTDSPSTRWPNSVAQLPILVRGLYYDQWHHPAGKPARLRHKEEFLAAVTAGLDDIGPIDPEDATRAVFAVLEHHIAPGEIEDVKAMLPTHLRDLWP